MDKVSKSQWTQMVITLALALGVALLVNGAVLKLFGQKSAARAEHSLVGILLLMAYVAVLVRQNAGPMRAASFFVVALIPCYLGTVFPDLDIRLWGIGGHRNPLFHSSLSFLVLWVFARQRSALWQTVVSGYGIGLASHLWWDVLYYGDVRWLPGGMIDRLWLGMHGLLCLAIPGGRWLRVKASGSPATHRTMRASLDANG